MKFTFTNGFENGDFSKVVSTAVDYELKADEKGLFLAVEATAASKTLTLGLEDGDQMIVTNIGGTNAITIKNVADDTGTSVAKGKAYLVIASTTADGSTLIALNPDAG